MKTSQSEVLTATQLGPLELCPDFVERAARHEAWWRREAIQGRPLLLGSVNSNPARPITRRLDLLDDPSRWLTAKLQDVAQLVPATDALPYIRVDFGPCCLPAFMGLDREYGADTGWSHAFIRDDWSNAPDWRLEHESRSWKQLETLLDLAAGAARGKCLVGTPNLGGPCDILSNLRGATELCLDVLDQPERILEANAAMMDAYEEAYRFLHASIARHRAGLMHWHLIWSDQPYMIAECDLSFSVGPDDWKKVCLPDIERQSHVADRCIFHLDGSGSTRHIEALLEIPSIHAIQYTPGAGTPSALAWLDMFRLIQRKGRSLLVFAPVDEVPELARALRPEGLAIQIDGTRDVAHLRGVCRASRGGAKAEAV
jgi:hypothetical protein